MSIITTTSDKGTDSLIAEEGDVLKAYRDIGGTVTIGAGLTAASGVVNPKMGMTITRDESRRLLCLALARNYEPGVVKALPTDKQNVFDGAVIWHWNTGAISRATWVGLYLKGSIQKAKQSFLSWNKVDGKTVTGLANRRVREWNIIEFASYPSSTPAQSNPLDYVRDLATLGYPVGSNPAAQVLKFQADQKLTVDGIVGPATRAAIKRALQAKATHQAAGGGAITGGTVGAGADAAVNHAGANPVDLETLLSFGVGVAVAVALVYGASMIWRHRGPLFAWLPEPVKDLFEAQGIVLGRRIRS